MFTAIHTTANFKIHCTHTRYESVITEKYNIFVVIVSIVWVYQFGKVRLASRKGYETLRSKMIALSSLR